MNKFIIKVVVAFFAFLPFASNAQESNSESQWKVEMGQKTPDFDFFWKDNKADKISNHSGKVVMINFFATWCPPCRQELPRVQEEIWNVYKDHPEFELFVFGREENWDVLDPFIEKTGYTFPILPDLERGIFNKFATQSIPRNVILNRNGEIIYQSIGFTDAEFNKMLEVIRKEVNP